MSGTGQDDVDRALAAVGTKSFVYRSFRRQPRPVEIVAPESEPKPEPEPVVVTAEAPQDVAEPAVAEASPPMPPAEEPPPMPISPTHGDSPAQVLTFEAAAPVFATAPPAPPAPPPPTASSLDPAVTSAMIRTEPAAPSEELDHQSVAAMFRLLTGRAEPSRRPEPRRRIESAAAMPAPRAAPPQPTAPRAAPGTLDFGLANHLSSRLGTTEPRPGVRDPRPDPRSDPRPPAYPVPQVTQPSIDAPPVDEGLFRRL